MPGLPLPDPPLSDGVVTLRGWRDADAAAKAAWGRDPDIVEWTGVPANYSEHGARAWARQVEQARRDGLAVSLAIVHAASGAVLGSCDLRLPDGSDPGLGEVGYLLGPEARGRGYATRAIALLVAWGFRDLGVERVQGLVHPGNPPSWRVLERLGFRREGILRRYRPGPTEREDRIVFSLLPGELLQPGAESGD